LLYQNSIPNYIQEENILSESIMQNNQNNQNEPIIRFNQSDSDSDDRKLDDENQGNFQLNRIVESQNLNANNVIKNENDLEKFKNKFSPEFKNDINGNHRNNYLDKTNQNKNFILKFLIKLILKIIQK